MLTPIKTRSVYILTAIFISALILFQPVLTTYFSQDDFFHFKVSQTDGSLKGLINLFGFHDFEERKIAFYRPLSRELPYHIYYQLFGLNSLPFRIFEFLIYFTNTILVFILMRKLFKEKISALIVTLFFALSSTNASTFYYLAGGIQTMMATTFILLNLISFLNYLETKLTKFQILSFLSFLLALGSHELSSTLPAILALIYFLKFNNKQAIQLGIKNLWPYFLVLIVYFYLDVFVIGFSSSEKQYQIAWSIKTFINSLSWYTAWALGIPSMLLDFLEPGFKLNPNLMRYWGKFFQIIIPAFFALIIILFCLLFYKVRKIYQDKLFWFFSFWFIIGLLPVALLPLHKQPYYLIPVLPAFFGILVVILNNLLENELPRSRVVGVSVNTESSSRLLLPGASSEVFARKNKKTKVIFGLFLVLFLILNITSVKLEEDTFWAASRGRLAEKLLNQIKSEFPTLPKGASLYIKNDPNYPFVAKDWGGTSKQAAVVLNNSDALQLLYQDPKLKVYYEDINKPEDLSRENFYQITAKIN